MTVLISSPLQSSSVPVPWAKPWSPLTAPLPTSVHLFGAGRRAFQSGAGSGNQPAYPSGPRQGTIRLQHIEQPGSRSGSSTTAAIDLGSAVDPSLGLELGSGMLTERVLSLARRPDQVQRRSWVGVGAMGKVQTPSGWRRVGASASVDGSAGLTGRNTSSLVDLEPLEIRSFVFGL
jgi:hypothetical protein